MLPCSARTSRPLFLPAESALAWVCGQARWAHHQLLRLAACSDHNNRPTLSPCLQAEEHFLKYEAQRAKKIASKSHRERIKELNEVGWRGRISCLPAGAPCILLEFDARIYVKER